jgi:dipeptidyl aminopeptidase/acylaminoacyl peptidase
MLLLLAAPAAAQAPGTEIFLVPVSRSGATLTLGAPVNLTNRPGYDNQPAFAPDGRALYFTSQREGQTDLFRVDLGNGKPAPAVRVTESPESEYSPTVIPAGTGLSAVVVERDSTQRLWAFDLTGKPLRPLFEAIKPVGYHAWAGPETLYLFVLGSPATLQRADLPTGQASVVARDIGRTIALVPGGQAVSFLQRDSSGGVVTEIHLLSGQQSPIARLPEGAGEFYAWTPAGEVLAARGNTLHLRARGDESWRQIAAFTVPGLQRISRIAVSPDGSLLALVGEEPRTP